MMPGVTNLPVPSISIGARRNGSVRPADRLDHAVGEDDRAAVDPPAFAVEHGRTADHRQRARIAMVGRRIRILVDPYRRRLLRRRRQLRAGAEESDRQDAPQRPSAS